MSEILTTSAIAAFVSDCLLFEFAMRSLRFVLAFFDGFPGAFFVSVFLVSLRSLRMSIVFSHSSAFFVSVFLVSSHSSAFFVSVFLVSSRLLRMSIVFSHSSAFFVSVFCAFSELR
eukprot:TRINITY_DN1234_c0_g1_i4.p2 TRINITY_DN1234_c0_g1~~TRINITY_DN1234_c0_g1_i4.p2  ORF type:complete len:116 (+),score=18.95 TRINITY_DN1234_c0_g1_i4:218-565(+)